MATLQKIRNKAGLLISIFIGFALLAFILGDLLRSGDSMFSQSQNEVAEIAGKAVPIQAFQAKIDENIENYKRNSGQANLDQATMNSMQDQTWEQMVREYIMSDEYDELGIGISGEELFDMVQGNNIDPQILQIPIFQNQETGQFDRNLVVQFLKNMELDPSGNAKASWSSFEKALAEQKVNEKYNSLISKGLYVTSAQAKNEVIGKTNTIDFDYVRVAFNTVSDSAITVTDSELKAYYNANKEDYKQNESREINYVLFPIVASQEDEAYTEKGLVDLKDEFAAKQNNELFVKLESDIPFDDKYYSEAELPFAIQALYSANEGDVYGPYKDGDSYKLAKAASFKNIPDSVKARHILLRPDQTFTAEAARVQADSLLAVIKKGGNFAKLAKEYSTDGSSQDGGDLGWFTEGAMVKPFNDACFFGKKGDLVIVESQFGVHIVEVIRQAKATRKLQVAIVGHNIVPSSKTYQNIYSTASKFGGTNRTAEAFNAAANKDGLALRVATLKRDDRKVSNLENPRPMIKWAYEADKGNVSDIFEFGDNYIIASLKIVKEEGYALYEDVMDDVERQVTLEKKGDYLALKISEAKIGANTLQAIADKLDAIVSEAKNTNFQAYSIAGVGFEPELQGYLVNAVNDEISEPVKGKSGVFVVQVKNVKEVDANIAYEAEQKTMARGIQGRVGYQVFNAIKEASSIEDNRSRFY